MNTNINPHSYRKDIEGLRAVAVLLVVLYHFGVYGFFGGYVGVDVFFVISGYLITKQLLEAQELGSISLRDFYNRRVRRILGLSTIVLITTGLMIYALEGKAGLSGELKNILGAALMAGNVTSAAAGEYLSGVAVPSPFRHYWSLAVEEQFYLVWPVLLIGFNKILNQTARTRSHTKTAVGVSLGVMVISFTLSVYLTPKNPAMSYYLIHTRAWEIAAGALLAAAMSSERFNKINNFHPRVLSTIGLGLILVGSVLFNADTMYPGYLAALPVLGACFVIITNKERGFVKQILSTRIFDYLGKRSFSIYLWHWPVLILPTREFGYLGPFEKILALLLVLVLSEASYRFVENPLRYSIKLRHGRRTAYMGLLLITSPVLVFCGLNYTTQESFKGFGETPSVQGAGAEYFENIQNPTNTSTTVLNETTIVKNSTVTLVGDSTLAPLRWFVDGKEAMVGFKYVLDAESCRKLSQRSCSGGREKRVPDNAVEALERLEPTDVLFVMGGYHSHPGYIVEEFKKTIKKARERGFEKIFWMNWRESGEFPGVGKYKSMYTMFNENVLKEMAKGGYEDVVFLDWNAYSPDKWFVSDKIHVNFLGTLGLGEYISKVVAWNDNRPCPFSLETTPCKIPTVVDPNIDLFEKYKVSDTKEHCYEVGEKRTVECRIDKLQGRGVAL